ncbi:hypothetical protein ACIPH4_00645 [Streptomyces tendae]|uniref:hypothetical protein n=1 Tax=Streptomyces tendae TaxID=1932 RepID=UPI0037FBA7E6
MGRKRMGASGKARIVAGALKRAPKSQTTGKDRKDNTKSATNFVAEPRAPRNSQRTTTLKSGPLSGPAVTVYKARKVVSGKYVTVTRQQQRNVPTLTDRVFRPMTRKRAADVSAAMHDPNVPTRKLSPRR